MAEKTLREDIETAFDWRAKRDARERAAREAKFTGKAIIKDPKTGKDKMYDTRRDSEDREWLYEENAKPNPMKRT